MVDTFMEVFYPTLGMLVAGAVAWAVKSFTTYTGIQIEAKHREALHSAIMTGIGLALAKYGINATNKQIIAETVTYSQQSVPDAIKKFGLDKERNLDVFGGLIEGKAGIFKEAIKAGLNNLPFK